jgi:hypothetical protein
MPGTVSAPWGNKLEQWMAPIRGSVHVCCLIKGMEYLCLI